MYIFHANTNTDGLTRGSTDISIAATCLDPRQARVVELKFFAGMELEEIAQALGIGTATVTRDWRLARGWLFQTLREAAP